MAAIIATIAVSAIPVALAYKIATGDVRKIEGDLHVVAGNEASFTVEFFPKSHLQLVGDQFDVRITEHDGRCPAEKVAEYLKTILTKEFQTQDPHAAVKVTVQQVQHAYGNEHAYGNGKAKAGLEVKEATYTVTVINDQAVPKYPVIYCPGVQVDATAPFLNTWFTSPTLIARGVTQYISWAETFSVSLCLNTLKDGVTINTAVYQEVSKGQQVTFMLKNGVPRATPATDIANKNVIQVYLEPGDDYEGWAVGFGVADPSGKDNPTTLVQADANKYYNFTPTPYYMVGLASEDDTNKLVSESELTNVCSIQFSGSTTSVIVEYHTDGSRSVTYPSASAVAKPQAASKLIKRTVTSTTLEQYA